MSVVSWGFAGDWPVWRGLGWGYWALLHVMLCLPAGQPGPVLMAEQEIVGWGAPNPTVPREAEAEVPPRTKGEQRQALCLEQ